MKNNTSTLVDIQNVEQMYLTKIHYMQICVVVSKTSITYVTYEYPGKTWLASMPVMPVSSVQTLLPYLGARCLERSGFNIDLRSGNLT